MNAGAVFKATDQQKHAAQSEVFQRSISPLGFVSRSAPTTFRNESRFTAAHASRPVGQMGNAPLTAKGRSHIKDSNFALPGGRYPVNDAAHARNALARVSQFGTPSEKAAVRAKVAKKFPGIGG